MDCKKGREEQRKRVRRKASNQDGDASDADLELERRKPAESDPCSMAERTDQGDSVG